MKKENEKKEGFKKSNSSFSLRGSIQSDIAFTVLKSRAIPIRRRLNNTGKVELYLDLE